MILLLDALQFNKTKPWRLKYFSDALHFNNYLCLSRDAYSYTLITISV